jgi:short-subunit dehydrogenase
MKEYILLTGASSGIGLEMAHELAAKKMNLILVARTETKLHQMQTELTDKYGISVQYFAADLSDVNAAMDLYNAVQQENYLVTALINNAGVGNTKSDLNRRVSYVWEACKRNYIVNGL